MLDPTRHLENCMRHSCLYISCLDPAPLETLTQQSRGQDFC
jgi:hypothetical protein